MPVNATMAIADAPDRAYRSKAGGAAATRGTARGSGSGAWRLIAVATGRRERRETLENPEHRSVDARLQPGLVVDHPVHAAFGPAAPDQCIGPGIDQIDDQGTGVIDGGTTVRRWTRG